MSAFFDGDDIAFEADYVNDYDTLKRYEKLFLDYCEDHITGSKNKDSVVYYQSLRASMYFAQCMLNDSSDIETAYEVGFSVMFRSEDLN
ncbi:MAG: hypothetical protein RR277_08390 [Rikenellaceae bacterium]